MMSFSVLTARELTFIPFFGNHQVQLGKMIVNEEDTVSITSFTFYISSRKHQSTLSSTPIRFLLTMEDSLTFTIPDDIDSLCFGLDSIDNVNTSFEGALDPIHGMFWTWNSGYVNCKIEGTWSRSRHIHQSFTLHLGGYRFPYSSFFMFKVPSDQQRVSMAIDLLPVIMHALHKHEGNIMSTGPAAFTCSQILLQSMREYK
ncbi:MAG: MbnP family protein [Ignavibacteria bacterium]